MKALSKPMLLGSVLVGVLVAALLFVLWLSRVGGDLEKQYDIFFRESVGGLAKGSAVTFSGVPVGQVESIRLLPMTPEFIRVRITIDEETPVLVGTTATLKGVGFTGASQIELTPPDADPRRRRVVREIACPEINPEAQCPYGVPIIPNKPGALGQMLESAPEWLNPVPAPTRG